MPDVDVRWPLIGILALGILVAGCARAQPQDATTVDLVPDSALDGLLLSAPEIDAVMETTTMTQHPTVATMSDDRNLLPNLNCLGVWQVDQAGVYGPGGGTEGWRAVRQQMFRTPDRADWSSLAVQSVVAYPSADAARTFFEQSGARWSNCTNHHVNITLNDQKLPKWLSGDLSRTADRLAMPIARGVGAESRVCQHVLSITSNVIIDVEACRPPTAVVTAASLIADEIESNLHE